MGTEDCLYLNVYTKDLKPKVLRPVMFWIHGGGFLTGHGDDTLYGPNYLLRKDVVLVTINYRLGVFGKILNFAASTQLGSAPNCTTFDI